MTSKSPAPFRRVYHLNPLRLWTFPILWGLLVALFLVMGLSASAESEDRHLGLVLALTLTLIGAPFFGILWQSRLVLTAEGIAHHQLGYTVRSSWNNLAALSLEHGAEGLYLTQPGTKSALLKLASGAVDVALPGAAGVVGDPVALGQGRFIYLKPFMSHFTGGPLREDLLRCAPHLFAKTPA